MRKGGEIMKNNKNLLKSLVASASKAMVKMANGTASMNYSYQPKKPETLKK